MPGIQPVKGRRLRATKINGCGKPVAGSRNRLVTAGYVSLTLTAVMKDAEDLTQTNAEGKECFNDRTPPERRWWTPALELCNVNTGLLAMFTGWETILDALDLPAGFRDQREIESDFGIALELWTAGRSDEDCADIPTSDAILADDDSGRSFGYFLFGGTEWTPGDITIGATVSSFTLTGRTIAMPHWGLGPYNVTLDENGDPRRLVSPTSKKEHLTVFRTRLAPPDETPGTEPVALATSALFTGSNYYYGGPGNAAPVATAPEQGTATSVALSISNAGGAATGGDFKLAVNGNPTGVIAYNATPAAVKTALAAIDDGHTAADYTTSGSNLPAGPVNIGTLFDADITVADNDLTGPGAPYTINLA